MSDSAPPHSIPVAPPANAFHEFAYIVGKLKMNDVEDHEEHLGDYYNANFDT